MGRILASLTGHPLRTNQLLVIAGPPCAGKTTLVSRIREGAQPSLCERIGLRDPRDWTYLDATELARMSDPFIDRLVVHYDLMAQRSPQGYRYLPEMISQAGQVVLLTLWIGPRILRRRSRARLITEFSSLIRNPLYPGARARRLGKIWKRHQVFRDSAKVGRLYDDWFDFSSGYPTASHWVLDCTVTGMPVAERFETAKSSMHNSF